MQFRRAGWRRRRVTTELLAMDGLSHASALYGIVAGYAATRL